VLLRSKLPPDVEAVINIKSSLDIATPSIDGLQQLVDHFARFRESFEDELRLTAVKERASALPSTKEAENMVRFLYTGSTPK